MARSRTTKPMLLSTIKWMDDTNRLQFDPDYQREEVWTISQKQLLIDSLFKDYDIQKVYFRLIEQGTFTREVADGQQRLKTILGFLRDEFKMPSDADEVDGQVMKNKVFSGLHEDVQMAFQQITIDAVELGGFTEDEIKDLFLRLQNGTPLRAAEKRRGEKSNMVGIVSDLSKHKVFKLVQFTNKHYAHEDATAQAIHLQLNGALTDIKPTSIVKTYRNKRALPLGTRL